MPGSGRVMQSGGSALRRSPRSSGTLACVRASAEASIDVSGLWGAVEIRGGIRFAARGRGPVATRDPDDIVTTAGPAEATRLTRPTKPNCPRR